MICRPASQAEPRPFLTGDDESREMLATLDTVARTGATILIEGESGTGKELLARRIHRLSPRRDRELVSISCVALPRSLLESELFGHERGAFTGAFTRVIGRFELAHDTTLLLDEIGELELGLQAKLLRVLQERRIQRLGAPRPIDVDFRLVATTNRDLVAEVRAGRFRADLYYRLNVIPVRVKPLRERIDDVSLLLEHFLRGHARRGRASLAFEPAALEALRGHAWPGNVRELENLVERLVLTIGAGSVGPASLGLEARGAAPTREAPVEEPPAEAAPPFETVREMERWLIVRTLTDLEGNRTRTARRLGIGLRTLRNKIRDHGITEPATLPRARRGLDPADRAGYSRAAGCRARRGAHPGTTIRRPPQLRHTRPEL
jgi:transcriptional regulator with GAF, ATPase, and Fis domain